MLKAEYIYQPHLIFRRLGLFPRLARSGRVEYSLPWGMRIKAHATEEHGRKLEGLGVADLTVTETLWRLTVPGETVIDAGANIGCMTAILIKRSSLAHGGRVLSFEPHPEIFSELEENVGRWRASHPTVAIHLFPLALSNRKSSQALHIPAGFESNRGLAALDSDAEVRLDHGETCAAEHCDTVDVETVRLDDMVSPGTDVGVLKIDVEGHELAVLQGAERLLAERRIRDCIFEEHRDYPTDVTDCLERHGYRIFSLHRSLTGPRLSSSDKPERGQRWEPRSFLATLQPDRAERLLKRRGWQVLSKRVQTSLYI